MTHRFFVALYSWVGLASLLLLAADDVPDTEQFDGVFEAALLPVPGKKLSVDAQISYSVAASLSNYLAFLFRSPPAG